MSPADEGGVAYMAHIGGFAAGLILAFFLRRRSGRVIHRPHEARGGPLLTCTIVAKGPPETGDGMVPGTRAAHMDMQDYSQSFRPDLRMTDFSREALVRMWQVAGMMYTSLAGNYQRVLRERLGEKAAWSSMRRSGAGRRRWRYGCAGGPWA